MFLWSNTVIRQGDELKQFLDVSLIWCSLSTSVVMDVDAVLDAVV